MKGEIYNSKKGSHGSKRILASLKTRLLYKSLKILGYSLITYAIIFFSFTFGPIVKQEVVYETTKSEAKDFSKEFALAQSITEVQNEANNLGLDPHFSVYIPKISAKSNVLANVDISDKNSYLESLKKGVAHAKGTYFPGQGNTVYLFAHSTDTSLNIQNYNAVFYLLRKLEPGDQIITYFADQKYVYKVTETHTVSPDNINWLIPSGEEELILQTCDPPGTTWNRLLVVAKPV